MSRRNRLRPILFRQQRGAVSRGQIFAGLCVAGVVTVAGYAWFAKTRSGYETPRAATDEGSPQSQPEVAAPSAENTTPPGTIAPTGTTTASAETPTPSPSNEPGKAASIPATPSLPSFAPHRVFFRYNGVDTHYGRVAYVDPANARSPHFVEQLSCEVVYVAGGQGICLSAKRGVITTYSARLFDSQTFEVHGQFALNGVPSRSRVSRDGKLAAFTVFVTGHGYTALDFSTQTMIIDTRSGTPIADLETFAVTRDGKPFKESDFNFWGVTFTPDAREFYATLSSGGQHFLVRGNVEARTATVIHSNVECPSLSPDGTRVAYKKRFTVDNRIMWELHVLDLATGKETPLEEKRSIDDQLEWLDRDHVLYSVPSGATDQSASTDVWVTAADGSSGPKLYLKTAFSPSAVR